MYAQIENDTSELQTNVVREMRRQGYKNDGNAKSFDSALTKAVQNINKSPYRHNLSIKTRNNIMDVYEGSTKTMKNDKDVKFIRVNGRVVPIRGKK